uniref:Uncharacterized protein n=1 Tax=Nymphaea colorata TaxID=210225 RepID=A0A5K1FDI7_9MAGN
MELSHRLAGQGFPVTFVNTEHIHERLMAAAYHRKPSSDDFAGKMKMVAVPDCRMTSRMATESVWILKIKSSLLVKILFPNFVVTKKPL